MDLSTDTLNFTAVRFSTSANITEVSTDEPTTTCRVVSAIILLLIGIIGGLGNTAVINILWKAPMLKKRINYLMMNLATVDLLGCLVNIPIAFALFVIVPGDYALNKLSIAHIVVTVISLIASYSCFVCLAIDRNESVLQQNTSKTVTCLKLVTLFQCAMAAICIIVYLSVLKQPFIFWNPQNYNTFQRVSSSLLFAAGIFSVAFVIWSYYKVSKFIASYNQFMYDRYKIAATIRQQRELRLSRAILKVVITFLVTYLPTACVRIVYFFHDDIRRVDPFVLCRVIFLANYAANPILYITTSAEMYKRFLRFWGIKQNKIVPRKAIKHNYKNSVTRLDDIDMKPQNST